ncbi:MAG: PKD domain-containing protein, partial [Bacteroidota bacterium]
ITSLPDTNICVGTEIEFMASDFTQMGSNLTFDWDFGLNAQTSTAQLDTALYDVPGMFEVVLNIEEIATGCQNTITQNIDVQAFPEANFVSDADGQNPLCRIRNINFEDATNYNGSPSLDPAWDFDNGITTTGTAAASTFDKGTYTIEIVASTSYGCLDTFRQDFTIVGPEGDFTVDRDVICRGESITFTLIDTVDITSFVWDFGDGNTLSNQSPVTYQYDSIPPSGMTFAKLSLRGVDDACLFADSIPITLHQVIADFEQENACFDTGAYTFMNTSNLSNTFEWDFGDGNSSIEAIPTHVYANPGVYDVQLIVGNTDLGCQDSIRQDIELFAGPDVSAADVNICQGNLANLSVSDPSAGSTYFWSPEEFLESNGTPDVTANPLASTTFSVLETDINGCQNSDTSRVEVITLPDPITLDTTVCQGTPVALPVFKNPFIDFSWTAEGAGDVADLSCTDCSLPVVTVQEENQLYNLAVTAAAGLNVNCGTSKSSFALTVPDDRTYALPGAFTPDADGVNDFFNGLVRDESLVLRVDRFQVFNRWGNMVYDNNNPSGGWDGFYEGSLAPSDVYLYNIEVSIAGCPPVIRKGQVTLIR